MSSEVLYFLLLVTSCAFETNAFEHKTILQNKLSFESLSHQEFTTGAC